MSLNEVFFSLIEGLRMPFGYLSDIEKRIHPLYLLSSAVLAFYVYRRSRLKNSFLAYLFRKDVWLSRSARIDYFLIFFNGIVKVFLIAPYLVFGFYLANRVENFLPTIFGYPQSGLSDTTTIILFTIVLTLLGDLATYVIHYLMHRIPFLWEFHKVHHSATVLNPITQYRLHPIELIINNIRGILILGLVTGIFQYLSANPIKEMTFIGANVFSFAFLLFGSNLRHSHVRLRYFNWLEYIFISPFQHQIHHSNNPEHFNSNMGAKLAIWDWMFRTLVRSNDVEKIQFGLGQEEDAHYGSVWGNLYLPFRNLFPRKRQR
ncbi:MAG: sterol desaturase family protein [Flavobacteriales bacterium]|nr:sterol desaturase family protein [Flavobacteriales bacterium]